MKIIDICREAAKTALRGVARALGQPVASAEAEQFIGALSATSRFAAIRVAGGMFLAVRCDASIVNIVLLFSGTKAELGEKPKRCLAAIHAELTHPDCIVHAYVKTHMLLKYRTGVNENEFHALQERYARMAHTTS